MIATKPARDAFRHIPTSGFPSFIHVKIIQANVAAAAAIVVVRNTEPKLSTVVVAAPLNPYQPNQRINTPKAPSVNECPGIAFDFVFPSFVLLYFPIRGPTIIAPIRAAVPPII